MLTQSSAGHIAGPTDPTNLVLEPLPNGEYAWLRAELDTAIADADDVDQVLTRRLGWPEPQAICTEPSSAGPHYRNALCADPQPEEQRYALTQRGRDLLARWKAERWLFGREVA